jgi:predicted ATPase
MNRIKIKNFGPIRDSGWVDIRKVTVFLGNQGSGKSTLAKLISSCLWMEKSLYRGDYPEKWFKRKGRFHSQLLYHRLENYLAKNGTSDSRIWYEGDSRTISFNGSEMDIVHSAREQTSFIDSPRRVDPYFLPQILYVPAERNFIAYVRTPKELKLSSGALATFIGEYTVAREAMKGEVLLPINSTYLEYDRLNDTMKLRGANYRIPLSDAASGFQSCAPLFLVSRHLSMNVNRKAGNTDSEMSNDGRLRFQKAVEEIYSNDELSDEQRKAAISALSRRFKKSAFINIVEEPEQNLFPPSQSALLCSLLGFNNQTPGNKLIFTTHSPYLVNTLTLAVQAAELKRKIGQNRADLLDRLDSIIPLNAATPASDIAVYQLDESNGSVMPLPMPNGIPSDANYLNESLGAGNDSFGRLLDIEEELG